MSDLVLGGPPVSDRDDKVRRVSSGLDRRTLKDIAYVPEPGEILKVLNDSEGWEYRTNRDHYRLRDRALIALTYLLAVRVSEVLRLTRDQFLMPYDPGGRRDAITVRGIYLSKRRYKDKPRLSQYREEGFLPLEGERAPLTIMVVNYLQAMDRREAERLEEGRRPRRDDRLFRFKRQRAHQIFLANGGATCHWFRAFGETYLYDQWESDILAVADYVKVDPRTLQDYIRRGYKRHMKRTGPV